MLSKIGKRVGRRRILGEARDLIFRMVAENLTGGAPRIHGELLMLGFDVIPAKRLPLEEASTPRSGTGPALAGLPSFLRNPREAITAMDFVTVPTASFRLCTASLLLAMIGDRFCTSS